MSAEFQLARNSLGRLTLTMPDGQIHAEVIPVRAFPIAAPNEGIALVDPDGHEKQWIERLSDLPEAMRALVAEELADREFMPEIRRIVEVSTFATPSTWQVVTDRGETNLTLKGEEDIRRLPQGVLLVGDAHGIQFLIRHPSDLDKASRRLLDRFL